MASERELDEAWLVDLERREEAGRIQRAEMADRSIARTKERNRRALAERDAENEVKP